MVTDAVPDAAAVLPISAPDTTGMEQLAQGEYRRTVRERMPRDHVRMYHPDGTSSIVLLPPLGKNGRNARDRQQVILHHMMNKRGLHGEQWWYASPDAVPGGWTPSPLPLRCFVHGCTRAGGLPNWSALYRHVQSKHPGDMEMYKAIIHRIEERIENEVDPAVLAALGLDPDTAVTPEIIAQMEIPKVVMPDATVLMDDVPVVAKREGVYDCPHCTWRPKANAQRPQAALTLHIKGMHKRKGET